MSQRASAETESGRLSSDDAIKSCAPSRSVSTHKLEPSLEKGHGVFASDDRVGLAERYQRPHGHGRFCHAIGIDLWIAVEHSYHWPSDVDREFDRDTGARDVACRRLLNGHSG